MLYSQFLPLASKASRGGLCGFLLQFCQPYCCPGEQGSPALWPTWATMILLGSRPHLDYPALKQPLLAGLGDLHSSTGSCSSWLYLSRANTSSSGLPPSDCGGAGKSLAQFIHSRCPPSIYKGHNQANFTHHWASDYHRVREGVEGHLVALAIISPGRKRRGYYKSLPELEGVWRQNGPLKWPINLIPIKTLDLCQLITSPKTTPGPTCRTVIPQPPGGLQGLDTGPMASWLMSHSSPSAPSRTPDFLALSNEGSKFPSAPLLPHKDPHPSSL